MDTSILIGRLLCSRLCHDLLNPISAVGTGLELMAEGPEPGALDLVRTSASALAARLDGYRFAFGALGGGRSDEQPFATARRLAEALFAQGKVRLQWDAAADGAAAPADVARLALNMALLGREALARGGDLSVHIQPIKGGLGLAIVAQGPRAALRDDCAAVFAPDVDPLSLTPQTVQAYLTASLAREAGAEFELSTTAAGGPLPQVRLAALVPLATGVAAPTSI
jgi:histidine phosphotransferase ChpT